MVLEYTELAQQLRKPEGELGKKIGEQLNISNKLINEFCIDSLYINTGDQILEIGMGNGNFCSYIFSKSSEIKYTGIDFSEIMVEESISNNQELVAAGKAKFIHGEADCLNFSALAFNKVFTVNTIYFWEDADKVCQEIYSVLKPGGTFIIGLRPPAVMKELPFVQFGFRLYEIDDITNLLGQNNFKNIELNHNFEENHNFGEQTVCMQSYVFTCIK